MVLAEFADEVIGIEREAHLVEIARSLFPAIDFRCQATITTLDVEGGSCDFIMTFTVLQHMVDEDCQRVIDEIKRVTRSGGHVPLAEKIAPGDETTTDDPAAFLSKHRSVESYAGSLAPLRLLEARVRPLPPAWKKNPGGLMFFEKP